MEQYMWIPWLVLFVILLIVEGVTYNLVTIWFAIGAMIAALVAAAGLGIGWQAAAFLIVSAIMLIFTKPLVAKSLKSKDAKFNTKSNIGRKGVVIETIDNLKGKGQVKLGGQVWTARSVDNEIIPVDVDVEVADIEGVKAIVKRI